jgi:flagellar FliJ protein
MSSRAQQLQPAVEQARQRSEDALAQLATQQQLLARAEHQLSELQRYRQEYAAGGDGAQSVAALLNRQQVVERIDRAILQQEVDEPMDLETGVNLLATLAAQVTA